MTAASGLTLTSRIALLAGLMATGCSRSAPDAPVSISNLTVGLMRQESNGEWHVYSRGHTFRLVPNGECEVARKTQPCMTYGFEFDYRSQSSDPVLRCEARFNKPTDMFSSEKVESNDVADAQFILPLTGREGHYSQVASVFRQPGDSLDPWRVAIACRHETRELIRFTFTALHER
jgi:hypothetical protein